MPKFGKYPSIEAFLEHYEAEIQQKENALLSGRSFDAKKAYVRGPRERNVVDIDGIIRQVLPEDQGTPHHYHLHVQVTDVRQHDEDVEEDVNRCLKSGEYIFVAIRHGDRMGIPSEIPGISVGIPIELKGEWITRDAAYSHGGEKLSVMHFTHHDIGFVAIHDNVYR